VTLVYDAPSVGWLGDRFLGGCIRQTYGGEWAWLQRGWGLRLGQGRRLSAYPLHRVSRQFANGQTDAARSLFTLIPRIFRLGERR
jgi:hypothetical protein